MNDAFAIIGKTNKEIEIPGENSHSRYKKRQNF